MAPIASKDSELLGGTSPPVYRGLEKRGGGSTKGGPGTPHNRRVAVGLRSKHGSHIWPPRFSRRRELHLTLLLICGISVFLQLFTFSLATLPSSGAKHVCIVVHMCLYKYACVCCVCMCTHVCIVGACVHMCVWWCMPVLSVCVCCVHVCVQVAVHMSVFPVLPQWPQLHAYWAPCWLFSWRQAARWRASHPDCSQAPRSARRRAGRASNLADKLLPSLFSCEIYTDTLELWCQSLVNFVRREIPIFRKLACHGLCLQMLGNYSLSFAVSSLSVQQKAKKEGRAGRRGRRGRGREQEKGSQFTASLSPLQSPEKFACAWGSLTCLWPPLTSRRKVRSSCYSFPTFTLKM